MPFWHSCSPRRHRRLSIMKPILQWTRRTSSDLFILRRPRMLRHLLAVTIIALALAVIITPVGTVNAAKESSKKEGSDVEGSGFSLFETESIKGFDEKKVEKDPVCDRSKRPRITQAEPAEAKPGDRVVIKGENFEIGRASCRERV